MLPPTVMRRAIRRANAKGDPAIVYLHPWEVDPQQPRLKEASRTARFRHTVNLSGMERRLERLLQLFPFGTVSAVLAGRSEGSQELDEASLGAVMKGSA